MDRTLLVGDVTVTDTTLAIATEEAGVVSISEEKRYVSESYASLEEIAREFVRGVGRPISAACISVSGPVVDDAVWHPHHTWAINGARLREALDLPNVQLVNDMQATAMALPYLGPK